MHSGGQPRNNATYSVTIHNFNNNPYYDIFIQVTKTLSNAPFEVSSIIMTEDVGSEGQRNLFVDTAEINIALDPNLIGLAVNKISPAASTATVPTNGTETASDQPMETVEERNDQLQQALVANPYETYRQMPLQQLIPLILQQRESSKFSDLSEETLMQELALEENGMSVEDKDMDGDIDMQITQAEKTPKPQEITDDGYEGELGNILEGSMSAEQFKQMKKEVLENINLALNESSLSLEFVSLLLSSVRTHVGVSSMSPFLKRSVPPASLNADKLPYQRKTKKEALELAVISKGWKLRCLEEARSLLKDNYMKIEKSLEIEHAHWSMIAEHISNTDVMFKIRDGYTGKRSLAIKYGYEDSGSLYKQDRGIAVLRHNTDLKKLELVPISHSKGHVHIPRNSGDRFMRVYIYTNIEEDNDYILSGVSSIDEQSLLQSSQDDIGQQVAKLKFLIFERELMYQLKKESVQLISYDVKLENENKIVMEFPGEKIEIEMVPLDDNALLLSQDAPRKNDNRANLILIFLRMLLVVMHKNQLRQRLKPSAPKQKQRGSEKDLLLLRPIVGKIRHQSYISLLQKVFTESVLDRVPGATIEVTPETDDNGPAHVTEYFTTELDKQISLFDKILKKPKTRLRVDLPGKGCINLVLKSSNYCNAIMLVKYSNSSNETVFDTGFTEFKELEEFLNFIVVEYVL
ncbi:HHL298Wp [Eremothecium sinecaudum]|uniref:Mediator of RNA polymerase II transcription subunit 17 n=1 Tax=Eremothecium sinecaudum TaxID=45286 RepID=A0A109V090_9SACH|nr:HHL298Wp [Eremothecium sinecaudum]AMD22472.1 HHL298Wp [Eremothecium sinecaudum]